MKKYLIYLLVVVFAVSIVFTGAGCKATTAETTTAETTVAETTAAAETSAAETTVSAEGVVLKIADWQAGVDNILNSYKEFISNFEVKHPGVKVEYTQYSYTDYNEFLKPSLSGGTAPDIFAVYPGPDIADVAESGNIIAITDILDEEWKGWLGKAEFFNGARYNDKLWVSPQDAQTECIWIYKDMIESIGKVVPAMEQPVTVDELISWVEPAKAKGFDVILAGFKDSYSALDSFFNMVHQLQTDDSVDMVKEALNGKITWQQDIFRLPIEAFQKMHKAHVWREDAINMDYQVQAWGKWLEKGAIGIWCNGDWFAGSCPPAENNPENPNIGIFQYPLVNENAKPVYNWGYGTDLAIYSKGKNVDLAKEFVRYTNSPEAAQIFVKNFVNPACGLDITTVKETDNPIFNDCIKMYNFKGGTPSTYFYSENGEAQTALFDGIVNVMIGQDTIDNVLKNLDEICGFQG